MKRLIITLSFVLTVLVLFAIPAKRGLWQTLTLTDGSVVRAQLVGDEHMHFWLTEDGQRYTIQPDGKATKADMEKMRANAMKRRAANNMSKRLRSPRKVNIGDRTHYTGKKKGIVILMQFTDTKFKTANNQAKYNDILNKENYTTGSFKGSVADYFKAQSGGQFELTFDVLGPFPAKKNYAYYGKNDADGNDMHPDELVVEAVKAADDEVDFRDYDWDGDGKVDQVFIVYAGKGEADGGSSNTIWPHMYWLNKTGMEITLDSVLIDTYACANELSAVDGYITGIGCFCHEFSHCLGYPDFYDIAYQGWFGMSKFDLMDQGSYNGDAFRPAGYTAYEKWMAGWLEPTVLADEDVTVDSLVATSENGGAYVMYNDAHPDEFYMIENRQKTKWDTDLPGKGLMITHVDFDKEIWEQNTPNSKVTQSDIAQSDGELTKTNDHQRCTIFHADNEDDHKYWSTYGSYYTKTTLTTDLYPYNYNDSLTATSKPAASLFNKNSKGKKFMQGAILNITQNSDKTMNFIYRAKEDTTETVTPVDTIGPVEPIDTIIPIEARGDTLFYESFDKCDGTGGNDGKWSTTIATSTQKYITDNEGWEASKAYAGYQCARYGNGSTVGEATTPPFTINGEAVLTFRAAGWNKDGNQLKLSIRNYAVTQVPDSITTEMLDSIGTELPDSAATLDISQFTMNSFAWKDYTVNITGKGIVRLTFTAELRFLLDEVLVISPSEEPPVILVGDVNGDGTVDVADIAAIIDVMAGTIDPNDNPDLILRADVNGDGTVDVADIAMIIDIMAGISNEEP
ncbi:MAG: M6 family metalloprotease domain-containing protein [Prevotella sp.]|nr:M6 family metalloprotease domain-containing protein [Prevotella sp.]